MTIYEREPSQFPTNHERMNVSDPAVQRALDAGNLPPDSPEPEPTLRGEIANAIEMLAKAGAAISDIYRSRLDVWDGMIVIRKQHDALHAQLQFMSQLAENLEARR